MAAAPPHQPIVYKRSVERLIRVLDAKIAKLEVLLNNELEKIPSCRGLLEEMISQPQGSPCYSVRAELDKARFKREMAYRKLLQQQQQQQQLEMEIPDDGGAPNPPDAGGAGN